MCVSSPFSPFFPHLSVSLSLFFFSLNLIIIRHCRCTFNFLVACLESSATPGSLTALHMRSGPSHIVLRTEQQQTVSTWRWRKVVSVAREIFFLSCLCVSVMRYAIVYPINYVNWMDGDDTVLSGPRHFFYAPSKWYVHSGSWMVCIPFKSSANRIAGPTYHICRNAAAAIMPMRFRCRQRTTIRHIFGSSRFRYLRRTIILCKLTATVSYSVQPPWHFCHLPDVLRIAHSRSMLESLLRTRSTCVGQARNRSRFPIHMYVFFLF